MKLTTLLSPLAAFGLLAAAATLVPTPARADANYFGYVYGTDTLPKGGVEVYQWITSRTGKADGSYAALDLQTEFEYGFTDRLEGSLYINGIGHDITDVPGFTDRKRTLGFNGAQFALKYNLRSVDRGGWGVSLYFEPGYKRYSANSGKREDIFFVEPKILLQRNFLDDTLIWATNLGAEFEREHDLAGDEWESELELEASSGLSYRVAPRWFVGVEGVFTSAYERMHLDELGEYAVFFGPNVHYAGKHWWATLSVLPQITGWPENKGERNLDNYEALRVRLKLGYNF